MSVNSFRVGVVRGGPSSEYDVSIKTGAEVLRHLPDNHKALDILIDKTGQWHLFGFPKAPVKIFDQADILFNALHGQFGEDGGVQQIFESYNMPYTGSAALASALAMKKHLARDFFQLYGIKIPRAFVFRADDFYGFDAQSAADEVFNSSPPLWVVKPASCGSSVGVCICGDYSQLLDALKKAGDMDNVVLAEEYIKGKEATCGVLEDFRGEKNYALPPVEIIPDSSFFDYEAKYSGFSREICPAGFDRGTKRELENTARLVHQILGCRHYSRADFIVSDEDVYLLEVNTLPGLTTQSLFPKAAAAAGLEFPQLLEHLIELALKRSC